jgi:spore coat polysaccharide biosynthesis protein SpsF
MKTSIIVQARMTSTRLPGKVLLDLAGKPMLERLMERLRRVHQSHSIVVATTTNTQDEPIVALCKSMDVNYYRGSEHDVLSRYFETASLQNCDAIVRITSDCPLIDPTLIDEAIHTYTHGDIDYVSNMLPPTWPYGMAIEVFSFDSLRDAYAQAQEPSEREHVTPFIYRRPTQYRLHNIVHQPDLSQHRWTVDTPEDYALVSQLFKATHQKNPYFGLTDLLEMIEKNPDWALINQHIEQKCA